MPELLHDSAIAIQFGKLVRKDLIRIGTYAHPKTKQVLDVTADRMDHWIKQFDAIQAAGISIPIVIDHGVWSDNTIGYPKRMFRARNEGTLDEPNWIEDVKGDNLVFDAAIERESAIADIGTVLREVSAGIIDQYEGGEGQTWEDAIDHISVGILPVIPKQANFQPIAASSLMARHGAGDRYLLSTGAKPMNPELLKALVAGLGLPEDTTEETLGDRLPDALTKIKEASEKIDTLTNEIGTLKQAIEDAKKSPEPKPEGDPNQDGEPESEKLSTAWKIAESAKKDSYIRRIHSCIRMGQVTPGTVEKCLSIKANELPDKLAVKLSTAAGPDQGNDPLLETFLKSWESVEAYTFNKSERTRHDPDATHLSSIGDDGALDAQEQTRIGEEDAKAIEAMQASAVN